LNVLSRVLDWHTVKETVMERMERAKRVLQYWNWLPAFRAVAESEHLPTAAKALNLSSSALSRTISLLEDRLQRPLFRRTGGRLEICADGRVLLKATRDAMRLVDDGLDRLCSESPMGPIFVAVPPLLVEAVLWPPLATLVDEFPKLIPHIERTEDPDLSRRLHSGTLDFALSLQPEKIEDLAVSRVASVPLGAYCSEDHPLAGAEATGLSDLREQPFVTLVEGAFDGWPPEHERRIGARVGCVRSMVDLCATGRYLALLPDCVVERSARSLTRLAAKFPSVPLYSLMRRPQHSKDRALLLLHRLEEHLASGRS
jgi:DNA-binding transcriptional LysR family regulator